MLIFNRRGFPRDSSSAVSAAFDDIIDVCSSCVVAQTVLAFVLLQPWSAVTMRSLHTWGLTEPDSSAIHHSSDIFGIRGCCVLSKRLPALHASKPNNRSAALPCPCGIIVQNFRRQAGCVRRTQGRSSNTPLRCIDPCVIHDLCLPSAAYTVFLRSALFCCTASEGSAFQQPSIRPTWQGCRWPRALRSHSKLTLSGFRVSAEPLYSPDPLIVLAIVEMWHRIRGGVNLM